MFYGARHLLVTSLATDSEETRWQRKKTQQEGKGNISVRGKWVPKSPAGDVTAGSLQENLQETVQVRQPRNDA